MRILSRYLMGEVLTATFFALLAFMILSIIVDMFDNLPDFLAAKAPVSLVMRFYIEQAGGAMVVGLPIAVLLGTLYCLYQMSRHNEFVAMQAAGLGLWQFGTPFIGMGVLASFLLTWFNWEWGPQALINRDVIKERLRVMREMAQNEGRDEDTVEIKSISRALIYRSRDAHRIWFIQRAELDAIQLKNVEILQMESDGRDLWKYYIGTATWEGREKGWRLADGVKVVYDRNGNAIEQQPFEVRYDRNLTETFSQVTAANPPPDMMSLPALVQHLLQNAGQSAARLAPYETYYYYRLSSGFNCLVAVLWALPLALTTSRREVFTVVGKILIIFFGYLTLVNLFVALGRGARIPAWLAGVGPVILFCMLGFGYLLLRTVSLEIPFYLRRPKPAV